MPRAEDWREDPREFRLAVEVPGVLELEQCDTVMGYVERFGQRALEGDGGAGDGVPPHALRTTCVPRTGETAWMYERLAHAIDGCNRRYYGFDLRDFIRDATIADYRTDDFLDWHLDADPHPPSTKLSICVALSEPDDYDGGDLSFPGIELDGGARGDAVVFPSFLLHGVQPVTRGRRCSLIARAGGPWFR